MGSWKELQFDKISKFIDYRGRTPKKTELGLRLITAKNVRWNLININPEEFISPNDYDEWMTRGIPQIGDVLFTTEAPLGNVAQLDTAEKVAFAQRLVTFQPLANDYDSTFLKYYLLSPKFQKELWSKATGTTVKGIKTSILKKFKIPLPPLSEQRAIVTKLDALFERIDTAIALVKENIAHTEALMGSVLDEEFGRLEDNYGLKRMDSVVNLSRGHNPPKKDFIFKAKEGYVRFLQIRDGSSDNHMTYVPDTKKLHKVTKDDLLLVAYRHVGKVFRNMEGAFNVALCKIENKDESLLNMTYLYHCVSSRYIKGELLKRSERALIPSMSIKHLEKIEIPFPPIEIQNNMALKFEKLLYDTELLKSKKSSALSYLEGLKQSLLDVAFKGELV